MSNANNIEKLKEATNSALSNLNNYLSKIISLSLSVEQSLKAIANIDKSMIKKPEPTVTPTPEQQQPQQQQQTGKQQ